MTTTLRSGNDILLDRRRPFEERLVRVTRLWVENGRGATGLLTGKPLLAASCWKLDRNHRNEHVPEDIASLIESSHEFFGSHAWNSLLHERGNCSFCYETYHIENIQICTGCMRLYCHRCGEQHRCATGYPVG